MSLSSLFGKPKIPLPPAPVPQPSKNTPLEAQAAAMGRRSGLLATLFGYKNPSGTSGGGKQLTGR